MSSEQQQKEGKENKKDKKEEGEKSKDTKEIEAEKKLKKGEAKDTATTGQVEDTKKGEAEEHKQENEVEEHKEENEVEEHKEENEVEEHKKVVVEEGPEKPHPESWQDESTEFQRKMSKRMSLKVPKEKVNDPSLPQEAEEEEEEEEEDEPREGEGKTIAESRSRRPTTPIPLTPDLSDPEAEATQVLVVQDQVGGWTMAGRVGRRGALEVPPTVPVDQSPRRDSIGSSRARRPPTPIPNTPSAGTSLHEGEGAGSGRDDSLGGGGGGGGGGAGSQTPAVTTTTTTIIQRVKVSTPPRFPGAFFDDDDNIRFRKERIVITVTSPDGITTAITDDV